MWNLNGGGRCITSDICLYMIIKHLPRHVKDDTGGREGAFRRVLRLETLDSGAKRGDSNQVKTVIGKKARSVSIGARYTQGSLVHQKERIADDGYL